MGTVRMRVASLSQLDELVGKHVTGEVPETSWEDSNGLFHFETQNEARDAIRDSYYHRFYPQADWEHAEVVEVKRYHPYSSDLSVAWQVVEQMSSENLGLEMRREGRDWIASFGGNTAVAAQTAPLAICLAGLRTRSIDAVVESTDGMEVRGMSDLRGCHTQNVGGRDWTGV